VEVRGLRPAPGCRTRDGGSSTSPSADGAPSSRMPRRTVSRAMPVAAATALIPPRPRDRASAAAQRRRARSLSTGWIARNFSRMRSRSLIETSDHNAAQMANLFPDNPLG
jgi:hypothetical protein